MLAANTRVMINADGAARQQVDEGICGTVQRAQRYSDGTVEYRVILDYHIRISADRFNGLGPQLIWISLCEWFLESEVEILQ